jgi:hypothetical protein
MNSVRSTKATYIAAFLLGALIAIIFAAPARSTESLALEAGAKDAARLVELPPGASTVVVQSARRDTRGGEVLIKIYSVPNHAMDVSAQPGL